MIIFLKGLVRVNAFCHRMKSFERFKPNSWFEKMRNLMTRIFCMRKERSPIYLGWDLIMVKAIFDFKKLTIEFFGFCFPLSISNY